MAGLSGDSSLARLPDGRSADSGVVQIKVTHKTRNPFTIKALWISGVTWNWHVLNHAPQPVPPEAAPAELQVETTVREQRKPRVPKPHAAKEPARHFADPF